MPKDTHSTLPVDAELVLPEQVTVALTELAGAAREGLLALAVGTGLGVLASLLEADLDRLVGPKGRHNPGRAAVRHGTQPGQVTLGGRRVRVECVSFGMWRSPSGRAAWRLPDTYHGRHQAGTATSSSTKSGTTSWSPGRVSDCYLGLRLGPADAAQATGVLVVAPAVLLHPTIPEPGGTLLYELVTGHPDRAPCQLVFLADLTVEPRAWPADTWAKVGVDPQTAALAVVTGWQRGDLPGRRLGPLTAHEALALERPAMTYVRAQLGDRLQGQLARTARRQ
jgi:hypothetical protein